MLQIMLTGKVVQRGEKAIEFDGRQYTVVELAERVWVKDAIEHRVWYVYVPVFLEKRFGQIGKVGSYVGFTANKALWGKVFSWQADDCVGIVFAADVWIL